MAGFAIIAVFIVAERTLRRDPAALTIEATPDDRGTTRRIGAAYAFALTAGLLSPFVSRWRAAQVRPNWLPMAGLPLMLAGLALRVWAAMTLGCFYTRTLRTSPDQQVVQIGPYAVVRHPGYLADLVMWLGFGQCSGTWIVAMSIALAMALAYARRIDAEEAMMRRDLGSVYERYCQRTPRLVPGIY